MQKKSSNSFVNKSSEILENIQPFMRIPLRKYLERITKLFTICLLVLFGSVIKNMATRHSDIDILLVAENLLTDQTECFKKAKITGLGAHFEPHIFSPNEVRQGIKKLNFFLIEALYSGKALLFDRFFEQEIRSLLNETIQNYSLERTEKGWIRTIPS